MPSILIKNARMVTEDDSLQGDILIENGKITQKGKDLKPDSSDIRIIDASGLIAFPGGIDPHVHMALPLANGEVSADDFDSGSRAAIAGGTTSIIDFIHPDTRRQSLKDAYRERMAVASNCRCDYGMHMGIISWNETTSDEMAWCVEQGITSFKVYLAYKNTVGVEDPVLIHALDRAGKLGGLVIAHCENADIITYLQKKLIKEGKAEPRFHAESRPPKVEESAVNRAIMISKMTGGNLYIVHVSSKDAADEITRAREAGQKVMGEACIHHLILNKSAMNKTDFAGADFVMSPPLRSYEHTEALWRAIQSGTLQTVATDHCPFNRKQREIGLNDFTKIPNGVPGVQNRMELLYTYGVLEGHISLNHFVALTSANAAKIFGLYPRKGTLDIGADADIVLWNPSTEGVISAATHYHRCDTTPYEGVRTKGGAEIVLTHGNVVFEKGKVLAQPGDGRFLKRNKGEVL